MSLEKLRAKKLLAGFKPATHILQLKIYAHMDGIGLPAIHLKEGIQIGS